MTAAAAAQAPEVTLRITRTPTFEACHSRAATTVDIVGCAQAENLHWEARIARAEQLLMVRMDAEGQRFLVDAARAWPAYRDAVCAARAYAEAAGGTLSQIIGSHCRVDLSALRAHELEGMLGR